MSLVGFKAQNHPQQKVKDHVDDRGTSAEFFTQMVERFGPFDLDVAAASHNAKCERYYTIEDDGLNQPWWGNVWCNPPYSNIGAWVEKAWRSVLFHGHTKVVMLLPANRTEQRWWQDWVEPYRDGRSTPRVFMRGTTVGGYPPNLTADTETSYWNAHDLPYPTLTVEFLPGRMRFDRPGAVIGPKGDRPPFGCCLLIWERAW